MTWLYAFGGLGLVWFGLRIVVQTFDEAFVSSLKHLVRPLQKHAILLFLAGMVSTLILQAPGLSIVLAMILVQHRLLRFENAFLWMLAAGFGSSIKFFFPTPSFAIAAPFLIGFSAFALTLGSWTTKNRLFTLIMALGLMLLGWSQSSQAIETILLQPQIHAKLQSFQPGSFAGVAISSLIGLFLTALLQDSSIVLQFLLHALEQNLMPPLASSAVMIGSNFGATLFPLLASWHFGRDAKRIAIANIFSHGGLVLAILLFFESFQKIIGIFVVLSPSRLALDLPAYTHLVFHLLMLCVWVPFFPLRIVLPC